MNELWNGVNVAYPSKWKQVFLVGWDWANNLVNISPVFVLGETPPARDNLRVYADCICLLYTSDAADE